METVIWIGPGSEGELLKPLLATHELQLECYESVDEVLRRYDTIPVAILWADCKEALATLQRLAQEHPAAQVVAATKLGLPVHASLMLTKGAVGILDLRGSDRAEIASQVTRAVARYNHVARQHELLARLQVLVEQFMHSTIELEKRNLELEEQLQTERARAAAGPKRPRIMVIDDEATVRHLFTVLLEEQGCDVDTFGDARTARAALAERPYQLVIADKNLPDADGLDLLREIKGSRPELAMILVTGYSSKDSAIEALHNGAAAYLEKPFDNIDDVATHIKQVLETQREHGKRRQYLDVIKQRNLDFLTRYRALRSELEALWRETDLAGHDKAAGASAVERARE